jgi:hypothetical protein
MNSHLLLIKNILENILKTISVIKTKKKYYIVRKKLSLFKLHYVRYTTNFLFGFIGLKKEITQILGYIIKYLNFWWI